MLSSLQGWLLGWMAIFDIVSFLEGGEKRDVGVTTSAGTCLSFTRPTAQNPKQLEKQRAKNAPRNCALRGNVLSSSACFPG